MQPPFAEGDRLTVTIERLAYGGNGVAHPQGFTIFVPRTVPGDRAAIRITDVRRRYARAMPEKIEEPSPDRIEPACRYFEKCGGCHYQHIRTDFWREQKSVQIQDSFSRLGPGNLPLLPLRIPGNDFGYRNRLTFHRSETGAQGYVAWDAHEIVDVESCPVAPDPLNELWLDVRKRLAGVPASLVPFAVLRLTTGGHRALVLSVTGDPEKAVEETLRPRFTDLPENVSLFVTPVEPEARSPFGPSFICLHGSEEIVETVGGISFHLRPDLFFQVHPEVTEMIVSDAVAWASGLPVSPVLDLFSGAGLFSLHIARTGRKVLGVEVNYPAVLAAQKSALANGLESSADFRGGKAETVLERLYRKGARFESAVVDPPRKGIPEKTLDLFVPIGIRHLLYVSCSPPTMARDLKRLVSMGFEVESAQPYDMFPQTYHVETVARLRKTD
jgi:23S rRNA (uracil1939-C5)-methyltransferase